MALTQFHRNDLAIWTHDPPNAESLEHWKKKLGNGPFIVIRVEKPGYEGATPDTQLLTILLGNRPLLFSNHWLIHPGS